MKKLTRASLAELARAKTIISFREQQRNVGGGTGTQEDPFTYDEFMSGFLADNWEGGWVWGVSKKGYLLINTGETSVNYISSNILKIGGSSPELYDGGTHNDIKFYSVEEYEEALKKGLWGGGFVQNYGYIGMEYTVEEKSRMTSRFGGNSGVVYFAEGVGFTAGINVQGYTVIENGNIIVSVSNAAYIRPEMNQKKPTGVAILYVNGQEKEIQHLTLQGSYIYRTGDIPIGYARFNLEKYVGKVEIKVCIYIEYYNGAGYNNHTYEEIVYSQDR